MQKLWFRSGGSGIEPQCMSLLDIEKLQELIEVEVTNRFKSIFKSNIDFGCGLLQPVKISSLIGQNSITIDNFYMLYNGEVKYITSLSIDISMLVDGDYYLFLNSAIPILDTYDTTLTDPIASSHYIQYPDYMLDTSTTKPSYPSITVAYISVVGGNLQSIVYDSYQEIALINYPLYHHDLNCAFDFVNDPITIGPTSVYDKFIVGNLPTGEFSGQSNNIAIDIDGSKLWFFIKPKKGTLFYIKDNFYYFNGTSWILVDSILNGLVDTEISFTIPALSSIVIESIPLASYISMKYQFRVSYNIPKRQKYFEITTIKNEDIIDSSGLHNIVGYNIPLDITFVVNGSNVDITIVNLDNNNLEGVMRRTPF